MYVHALATILLPDRTYLFCAKMTKFGGYLWYKDATSLTCPAKRNINVRLGLPIIIGWGRGQKIFGDRYSQLKHPPHA